MWRNSNVRVRAGIVNAERVPPCMVKHPAPTIRLASAYWCPAASVAVHWPPKGSVTDQLSPTWRG